MFYSQVAWDTVWQRPQEQALGLSNYRPVIFVSPVQIHEYVSRLSDRWKFRQVLNGGRLIVLSPLIFSGEYRNRYIRQVNQQLILKTVKKHIGSRQVICLTNSPFSDYLMDGMERCFTAFDYIDDFCAFGWSLKDGRQRESRLIANTDVAFAGTGYLARKYKNRLPGIKYLPSGVRFDFLTKPVPEAAELAGLPRPRILYVGTLNDRLDGTLFKAAAEANPGGSVIVVGPRHGTFECPPLPENVHFLGLQPFERLPEFYQHCDLGIMPFADNEAARAINPIKTLEYLACGMRVLSTPVPDVVKYYEGVVRAEAAENWPVALREMLVNDSDEERAARQDFARGRSWQSVVDAMEKAFRRAEKALC